tara:strand:+ start:11133 stop:12128 length:996 start_codon:yes stop_codon:yes gene_type:complete
MSKKETEKVRFLSASRIKTLETCSWTYWCKYHLGLPDSTNSGALRGTLCHLIFELLLKPRHKKHYDSIIKKKSMKGSPAVERLAVKHLKTFVTNSEKGIPEKEDYDLVKKMIYVGLSHNFFGHKGAVIDSPEQEFKIENKKPSYNIYGFMDKPIKYKKKKELKIVDYKSSKRKFTGEDLESNVQAMMYALAATKLWPEFKKIIVQFLFLRFPRQPAQELEFTKDQLKGFEVYLEHLNVVINNFSEKEAKLNYAAENENHWLCGPAKSGWICPFHKPFDYYVLLDEDGNQAKSSYENDLTAKDGQSIEKRKYAGCPAKNCSQKDKEKDLFDF